MSDDLIKFVLEGSAGRNGNIPADTFVVKLKQFLTTVYSFDRAFSGKSVRGINLEVVDLDRVNPSIITLRPQSKTKGYDANAATEWTISQFTEIHDRQRADNIIPQDALDNLVELSHVRATKLPPISRMAVEFRGVSVAFDAVMEGNALILRETRRIMTQGLWHAGVSRGSILGELRGVMDLNGERQFFVTPPSSQDGIQCLFAETMREQMNRNLFKLVRVHGFLRYDGGRPTPYLVEAERLDEIEEPKSHIRDMHGTFGHLEMPALGEFHDPRWT